MNEFRTQKQLIVFFLLFGFLFSACQTTRPTQGKANVIKFVWKDGKKGQAA